VAEDSAAPPKLLTGDGGRLRNITALSTDINALMTAHTTI